jgi:hypothetical protein
VLVIVLQDYPIPISARINSAPWRSTPGMVSSTSTARTNVNAGGASAAAGLLSSATPSAAGGGRLVSTEGRETGLNRCAERLDLLIQKANMCELYG